MNLKSNTQYRAYIDEVGNNSKATLEQGLQFINWDKCIDKNSTVFVKPNFTFVTKPGGYVIALEPNIFNHSGLLMNIFNTIKPGITGLVPHERALSPIYLTKVFKKAGLEEVECVSASYVWNRFPLFISRLISKHEGQIRLKKPFNLFGWFKIIYGRKANARAFENST